MSKVVTCCILVTWTVIVTAVMEPSHCSKQCMVSTYIEDTTHCLLQCECIYIRHHALFTTM